MKIGWYRIDWLVAVIAAMVVIAVYIESPRPDIKKRVSQEYVKGVNDALDAISLLALEQDMIGTNRTWGAMSEIVCERLKIKRRKIGEY